MKVLSFVYQEDDKQSTYIVSADSVISDTSGKIPAIHLNGGSYRKYSCHGELMESMKDDDPGAVPCWGNNCDDIVRIVMDSISRNEHVTEESRLDGLMCLLESCNEFDEAVSRWKDPENVAFIKGKIPIRKTVVCGNDIFSLVAVSDDRIYYTESACGSMLCLDMNTMGILNTTLEGCIKEAMQEDFANNKMVWYTPKFPYLAEKARLDGVFDSANDGIVPIVEFTTRIRDNKGEKDVTFRVVGKNVKAVPSNGDVDSKDAFPLITFDDGMVQVLKNEDFVAFFPYNSYTPEDVVIDVLSRLSCGETVSNVAPMSLVSVESDNPVFKAVWDAYTADNLYVREIGGRRIPEQILFSRMSIGLYQLGGASEDNLYYYSEDADELIVVDTKTGSVRTANSGLAEGLLGSDDEKGKLVYRNENGMSPIPMMFAY